MLTQQKLNSPVFRFLRLCQLVFFIFSFMFNFENNEKKYLPSKNHTKAVVQRNRKTYPISLSYNEKKDTLHALLIYCLINLFYEKNF